MEVLGSWKMSLFMYLVAQKKYWIADCFALQVWLHLLLMLGRQVLSTTGWQDETYFDNSWDNVAGSVEGQVRKGLNSIIILGA